MFKMFKGPDLQNFDNSKIKSSENALKFIHNIDIDDIEYFLYPDKLVNLTDLSLEVGKYEVNVKQSCYDLTQCIKVKMKSEIRIGGIFYQIKIICFIGQKLKTLYQTYEEVLQVPYTKLTRKITVKNVDTGYEMTRETIQNDDASHLTRFFSQSMMQGYVSEGASVLLHRLLNARGLPDRFSVIVFNQYWDLSAATYNKLENLKLPILGEKIEVSGIERVVYSADDYETIWQMYFIPDGHLMSKAQVGSPISMKVRKMTEYIEKDNFMSKPKFSMTELNWEDDVQLVSQFLDLKEVNKANSLKYLKDHPDIKFILKGFMQTILIRKPENPIEFASKYFISFTLKTDPNYIYENSKSIATDFLL